MDPAVRSHFTLVDFVQWREAGRLELTPKFQRRGVWSPGMRSYFIDTLIQGLPVPPIYLRQVQSGDVTKVVRQVVDGQQRLRTMLDFFDGKYRLSPKLDGPYAGKGFKQLDKKSRDAVLAYQLYCHTFTGASDKDILEVFRRMNLYSVPLSKQELRNGRYFGEFKKVSFAIAEEYLAFWRGNRVVSEKGIARMAEVELVSELLILGTAGLQDKKGSIDEYYEKYDDRFPNSSQLIGRFRSTLDAITTSFDSELAETEFRRRPLFYTLFGAIYHRMFGVPSCALKTPRRGKWSTEDAQGLASAVAELSEQIEHAKATKRPPRRHGRFVNATLTQTDNIGPRRDRLEMLYGLAF
jgi:hypothetical protein